jgi:hypothetical protein
MAYFGRKGWQAFDHAISLCHVKNAVYPFGIIPKKGAMLLQCWSSAKIEGRFHMAIIARSMEASKRRFIERRMGFRVLELRRAVV